MSPPTQLLRGRAYWFEIQSVGRKPGVVVSNNARNRQLHSALVARITTSSKPALNSIVPLGSGDPLVGSVLCDDLIEIYTDEVLEDAGALSRSTMRAVSAGLAFALGLD